MIVLLETRIALPLHRGDDVGRTVFRFLSLLLQDPVSTPEQKSIGAPEQNYITAGGSKAPRTRLCGNHGGIVAVLLSLQAELALTYVFVSPDLALVRQFAHIVSVMHRGRIVEHGRIIDVFDNPQHPYTASLLRLIPSGGTGGAPTQIGSTSR